jgi:hypothetical protein
MEGIVVTDDELKRLEKRFGPAVRQMGPWNSDGIFGYSMVPVLTVEDAAATLEDPKLSMAVSRLRNVTERTELFVGLLDTFGAVLIERIVNAYRDRLLN